MGNISVQSANSKYGSDTVGKTYSAAQKSAEAQNRDSSRFDSFQSGEQAAAAVSDKDKGEGRYDYFEGSYSKSSSRYDESILSYLKAMFGYSACTGEDGDSLASIISCLRRGSKSNIIIDPRFYKAMENDPDTAAEYIKEMKAMIELDKQFERQAKANGNTVLARGWFIDKEGGISCWSIVKIPNKKNTYREKMEEMQKKLREKRKKRAKEQKLIEERRSRRKEQLLMMQGKQKAAVKERLKRKARRTSVYEASEVKKAASNPQGYSLSISLPVYKP